MAPQRETVNLRPFSIFLILQGAQLLHFCISDWSIKITVKWASFKGAVHQPNKFRLNAPFCNKRDVDF